MPRTNNGPRLARLETGTWEVRWTEGGRSKRVSTRTTDRDEATRFLAGFILEMKAQRARDGLTAGEVIALYVDEHVTRGAVVAKDRQRGIATLLTTFFGAMTPDQITPESVLEYARIRYAGRVGSRAAHSPGTIRRELTVLKAAFSYAAKTRRVARDAVPYVPLPDRPGAKDLWLTEDELEVFLAAADGASARARLFCHIAANTASRRAAIETLDWSQVDMRARLIRFNPPGRAQSKKRRVPVPISDALFAVLDAVPAAERKGWVLGHPGSITRAFEVVTRAAAKASGNRKFLDVTPHTLRHTWATLAARAGVDLYKIAGVLGDSLATVQNNYLHHCPGHLRDAVNMRKAA